MRVGFIVALVAVVCALGGASQAGSFPDLPGIGIAEELTNGSASQVENSASTSAPAETNRVPAPDPSTSAAVAAKATTPDETATIKALPGAGSLPVFDGGTTTPAGSTTAVGALLALAICVLFTRFLVRLNTL
jgi:hypothetical protein